MKQIQLKNKWIYNATIMFYYYNIIIMLKYINDGSFRT